MKKNNNIFSIKNKVCVITGGCGGIGLALSKAINQNNGKLVIIDKIIKKKLINKNIHYYQCDLENKNDSNIVIKQIIQKYKYIDCLINAIGVSEPNSFEKNININLVAVYNVTIAIIKNMKKKGGSIINITSLNSELGFSKNPGYVSSKGALKMLTKSFCVDYAKYNIRINNLGPGYIKTNMTRKKFLNLRERKMRVDRIPLGRYGNPDDLVGPVIFLMSEASSYMTGQDLYIDGGFLAKGI
jgi:NAD(P)-dependent dehydrogenase (short-subunit alcohol dehydrogenase family)